MPLKTKTSGPAPKAESEIEDVVDEGINFFRANVFFKNFEVRSNADRVIVFLTVFIQKCLEVIAKNPNEADAKKNLMNLIGEQIPGSGDPKFFMSTIT